MWTGIAAVHTRNSACVLSFLQSVAQQEALPALCTSGNSELQCCHLMARLLGFGSQLRRRSAHCGVWQATDGAADDGLAADAAVVLEATHRLRLQRRALPRLPPPLGSPSAGGPVGEWPTDVQHNNNLCWLHGAGWEATEVQRRSEAFVATASEVNACRIRSWTAGIFYLHMCRRKACLMIVLATSCRSAGCGSPAPFWDFRTAKTAHQSADLIKGVRGARTAFSWHSQPQRGDEEFCRSQRCFSCALHCVRCPESESQFEARCDYYTGPALCL